MQNFAAIRSAGVEKMTFEVAIFGSFPDIPERKLSPYGEIVTTWLICIAAMLDARQPPLLT